jgi:hypothetical protein
MQVKGFRRETGEGIKGNRRPEEGRPEEAYLYYAKKTGQCGRIEKKSRKEKRKAE